MFGPRELASKIFKSSDRDSGETDMELRLSALENEVKTLRAELGAVVRMIDGHGQV
ncbi:MAG: hypothetical protein ACN4GZ_14430 [Acidimicrobiales bacterium]